MKIFRILITFLLEKQSQKLLKKHEPIIVAVTGSVGKTSTKLAIAHVLRQKYRVLVHEGNYNSELGLPLSILNLKTPEKFTVLSWWQVLCRGRKAINKDFPYDVVVLELGADKPGDISRFMRYLTPDIGVVTKVSHVHLEEFKNISAVLEEKWKLAQGSKVVFINAQDEHLAYKAATLPQPHSSYGVNQGDFYFSDIEVSGINGIRGTLYLKGKKIGVLLPIVGRQSLYPLVAAAAVGVQLNINIDKIKSALEGWQQPLGRMRLLQGVNDTVIIDDSYNASPESVVAALEALYSVPAQRRIAILGSMNELGEYTKEGHELVGKYCNKLDLLITVGDNAKAYIASSAVASGLAEERIQSFTNPVQAGGYVSELLREGDVVLVKGSQNNVFTEEAIPFLLKNKDDIKNLVRQSKKWQSIKSAFINQHT